MKKLIFVALVGLPLLTGCHHYRHRYVTYDHHETYHDPHVVHVGRPAAGVVHVEEHYTPHVYVAPPVFTRPWFSPRIFIGRHHSSHWGHSSHGHHGSHHGSHHGGHRGGHGRHGGHRR